MPWTIENLNAGHQTKGFSCGESSLDVWLKSFAAGNNEIGTSRVRVAVPQWRWDVRGYYTLSTAQVEPERMPVVELRRQPRFPIPCILLGRLATDQTVQGQGLGRVLLMHAFHSCLRVDEEVGAYALIVHALHEKAKAFYLARGFTPFADNPLHLAIHLRKIRELFAGERQEPPTQG